MSRLKAAGGYSKIPDFVCTYVTTYCIERTVQLFGISELVPFFVTDKKVHYSVFLSSELYYSVFLSSGLYYSVFLSSGLYYSVFLSSELTTQIFEVVNFGDGKMMCMSI